ncbi:spore protein SP21 [bacterium BMS3Abin05]|nr:spore protein SP21 [bacterium BMS3Abin05]GBE28547.1 spore protein SP21 [bacterium BMS3Bbin03]HDK35307.1 Hsp20/alpha crystallin family protein [Bacteroidota bacterium]
MPFDDTTFGYFQKEINKTDREVERLLKDFFVSKNPLLMISESGWTPHIDVYETKTAYIVKMEIAGVSPQDVHIQLKGRMLSIRGYRMEDVPEEREHFLLMEISYGRFSRNIELPKELDGNQVKAIYDKGILRIIVPKIDRKLEEPVRVPIQD